MKKNLLLSFTLVFALAIACKKDETIPDQVVSGTLAGDSNILYATTTLAGSNEVPAVTTTATGDVLGSFDKTTKILTLNITYNGITPTAWHIHKAATGVTGGVIFNFGTEFKSPFTYTSPAFTAAQEADLVGGLNYVNIHSKISPSGEIRGQLALAATKATGSISGTYNKGTKILTLSVNYAGITPTAWHIHKGAAGTSGPVVLDMGTTFVSPFNFSTVALTSDQEADLLAGLYYVNIHSKIAPSGEIRGQLIVQ
ncbi:CHRD domain-containing protein [Emticicia sp. SJ17W-69]|uniref:CHRD domain-containing protein n=1 Tax=Emticicia sp. SJ17W-69 TaxID=3421657 RepID=UPI003EB95605